MTLFVQALTSPDPTGLRQTALLQVLGNWATLVARLVMRTHLLEDSNVGVRSEAAFRLGKIGGIPQTFPHFTELEKSDPTPCCTFLGNMEHCTN